MRFLTCCFFCTIDHIPTLLSVALFWASTRTFGASPYSILRWSTDARPEPTISRLKSLRCAPPPTNNSPVITPP